MGTVRAGFLGLICLLLLFPLWLMVSNSFTPTRAFLKTPPQLIPTELTLDNYAAILRLPHITKWAGNSILVTALIVAGGVLVNGAAGYVFAFTSGKLWVVIFWVMLAPIFVSRMVLIISQFVVVGKLGMHGLPAVVSMAVYWPMGIFLFRNYFATIPASLLESARMDGAEEWAIFSRVVMPLCKPVMGASVVFLGMAAMGDYAWQMLNLQPVELQTALVGLINSTTDVRVVTNIGYDLAVGTVLFVPYLVLFAFSSRYFVKGLTLGAAKE